MLDSFIHLLLRGAALVAMTTIAATVKNAVATHDFLQVFLIVLLNDSDILICMLAAIPSVCLYSPQNYCCKAITFVKI